MNENFFNLPLKNIFSVISKVDFNSIETNDKTLEIIQNIIKNTINKHFEEKETILILQELKMETLSFSTYEEILSIIELITNCPLLVNFCNLYKGHKELPNKDYEYELQQKDKEIHTLKKKFLNINIIFKKRRKMKNLNKKISLNSFVFKFLAATIFQNPIALQIQERQTLMSLLVYFQVLTIMKQLTGEFLKTRQQLLKTA